MKRSILLALVAALALAVGINASASAGAGFGADSDAQATAKKKGKAKGKRKAAKCKTAKRKGKAKGKARARKSAAKGKAKGKAKRKCGKAKRKASPRRRPDRVRSPLEEKLIERLRDRQRERESRPPAPTIQDMVPADGTYTAASAPGLTVTIGGGATTARVVYTVPKESFDALCQAHTEGVLVDLSGPLEPSHATQRGSVTFNDSRPMPDSRSWGVMGSIGKDGSFTLNVRAMFPYPPDPNATCSGSASLSGTLVKQ